MFNYIKSNKGYFYKISKNGEKKRKIWLFIFAKIKFQ